MKYIEPQTSKGPVERFTGDVYPHTHSQLQYPLYLWSDLSHKFIASYPIEIRLESGDMAIEVTFILP